MSRTNQNAITDATGASVIYRNSFKTSSKSGINIFAGRWTHQPVSIDSFFKTKVMLSVSILEMYATQFESLVSFSKREKKVNSAPVKNEAETSKDKEPASEAERPQINYFAGPHSVFNPLVK